MNEGKPLNLVCVWTLAEADDCAKNLLLAWPHFLLSSSPDYMNNGVRGGR